MTVTLIRSSHRLRSAWAATALVLVALASALLASPAMADVNDDGESTGPSTSWQVQPSGPEGPGARTYFIYRLDPGAWVEDVVGITNHSDAEVTLGLFATDGLNVPQTGAFDLLPTADQPEDVGSWVTLPVDKVTVPPRSRVDVPFLVRVPDDATPGDHVGGIVTSLLTPGQDDQGNNVLFDARVAVRMYMSVSGDVSPSLNVEDLQTSFVLGPDQITGTMTVSYTIHNSGNVRLGIDERVWASALFGAPLVEVENAEVAELIPGGRIEREVVLEGVPAAFRLSGDVELTLLDVGGAVEEGAEIGTIHRSESMWAVPWLATGIVVAVLAVVGLLIWWGVSRWRRLKAQLAQAQAQAQTAIADAPKTDAPLTTEGADAS